MTETPTPEEAAERARWWTAGGGDAAPTVVVRTGDLAAGLAAVEHAIAADEARPILTTVLFAASPPIERWSLGGLRLVAADNYRIAIYDLRVVDGSAAALGESGLPLRRDDVDVLRRLLKAQRRAVDIRIRVRDRRLRFEAGGSAVEAMAMDGTFPKYGELFERPDLSAPPLATVALNPGFLADLGKAFGKRPHAVVEVRDPLTPVMVRTDDDLGRMTEILMPVRTSYSIEPKKPEPAPAGELPERLDV